MHLDFSDISHCCFFLFICVLLLFSYSEMIDVPYFNQPVKRKKEGEEKKMTQEEMLLEAAETGTWLCYSVRYV